jgi:hypothetical protein
MNDLFDIGFTGFAGAGKNAASDAVYKADVRYTRRAFADALKAIAKSIGWDGNKDLRGRRLLQDIGMAGRAYDPDLWVKVVSERLPDTAGNAPILWTDVRFGNEADFIAKRGGIIINITRPSHPQNHHISETAHLEIRHDYTIANDSTLKALHENVLAVVRLEKDKRLEKRLKLACPPAE